MVLSAHLKFRVRTYYLPRQLTDPVEHDRRYEAYLRASDDPIERKRGSKMTRFGVQGGRRWAKGGLRWAIFEHKTLRRTPLSPSDT